MSRSRRIDALTSVCDVETRALVPAAPAEPAGGLTDPVFGPTKFAMYCLRWPEVLTPSGASIAAVRARRPLVPGVPGVPGIVHERRPVSPISPRPGC
jgi:hypothetical protein